MERDWGRKPRSVESEAAAAARLQQKSRSGAATHARRRPMGMIVVEVQEAQAATGRLHGQAGEVENSSLAVRQPQRGVPPPRLAPTPAPEVGDVGWGDYEEHK